MIFRGRDDYRQLIMLCQVFLSSANELGRAKITFYEPGACHLPRWMSKAIYCIKIYMFQYQFYLTDDERKAVTDITLFISVIYGRYWNEAP